MAYLAAFLMCVCLSVVSTWYVRKLANARGWIHEPKLDRHLHTIPVPRLGGVAIYFSFMIVVILAMALPYFFGTAAPLHAKAMVGLLGPALIVFLLGLYDDVYSLNAYWKFGIETTAAVLLYAGGYGIHNLGLIQGGQDLDWIYGLPLTVVGTADYKRVQLDRWIGWAGGWVSGLLNGGCVCDVADSAKPVCCVFSDRACWSDARFLAIQFPSGVHFFGRFGKFVHRIHVSGAGACGIGEGADDRGGSDSYRIAGAAHSGRVPRRGAPLSGGQAIV